MNLLPEQTQTCISMVFNNEVTLNIYPGWIS